ncbi:MAG: glycosyltransferase family 39 protein [Leptolyngbyaceae bacterium]|nr:glycosyltransferase family 39 protein [Leptolyngbyaceae bacterium]
MVLLLVLGVFFRFYQIDQKVYWYDETMTSLRMSGYTQAQFEANVYGSGILTVDTLREGYQYPDNGSTSEAMWAALRQHPEHSPVYYVLARSWMQVMPNTVFFMRLLSVLISLLVLPCMYWLTWELFGSSLVSWVATALVAISPFHVLYAQEAREYALWTVTILGSSATLLWALRQRQPAIAWTTYGVVNALALYVHPFSGLVGMSHGLYVLMTQRWRLNRQTLSYAIATGFSILLFLPWLGVVLEQSHLFVGNTASVTQPRSGFLPLFWLLNLSRLFFDLNQGPSAINPAHYLLLLLVWVASVYLCRQSPSSRWSFVLLLMGVTGLALLGPDVLLGGRRSSITRYAIPAYLGIQISVAFFLANQIITNPFAVGPHFRYQRRWQVVAIALALAGIISCGVNAHNPVWWHKSYAKSRRNPDVARVINGSDRPLVITDKKPAGQILSLIHLLEPEVSMQLVDRPGQIRTPQRFSDIFLYLPSDRVKQQVERKTKTTLEPVTFDSGDDPWLWRVSR